MAQQAVHPPISGPSGTIWQHLACFAAIFFPALAASSGASKYPDLTFSSTDLVILISFGPSGEPEDYRLRIEIRRCEGEE